MKMFFWTGFGGRLLAALAGLSFAAAGDTILSNDDVYTASTNQRSVPITLQAGSLSTPFAAVISTTTLDSNDAHKSGATFGLTNTHLNITIDQVRDGSLNSYSDAIGSISFMVSEDTTYSLAGSYEVADTAGPGHSFFSATLLDQTDPDAPVTLYSQARFSDTLNAHFSLAGTPPYSLTGTLLKDHIYEFNSQADIQALNGVDQGARASGYYSLGIGADPFDPRTVDTPEPGVVWAGSVLLAALGARQLLRRRGGVVNRA